MCRQTRGTAKARLIDAQSLAAAQRIEAQAIADAEVMQAQGKKEAAALLESSNTAIDLAKLEKTGALLDKKTTLIFGSSPAMLPALMSNSSCFKGLGNDDNV